MKLLLDQNLSRQLVGRLKDVYPQIQHVALVGLERTSDEVMWDYARTHEYLIVTKDSDFSDIVILRGTPPKVLWLQVGNCATSRI